VVLVIALAACAALRQRSAAVRHMVLAAGIFSAAVVAPLMLVMPVWNVSVPRAATTWPQPVVLEPAVEAGETASPGSSRLHASDVIAGVIPFVGGMGIALLALGVARLVRLTSHAAPVVDDRWLRSCARLSATLGLRRPPALLRTRTPHLIATWGLYRPCVLLPFDAERWDEARIAVVLAHELAHVRRHDWVLQIGSDVVRAVFWFSPLLWVACRHLRREGEQACDDAVLRMGVAPEHYAAQLVDIARVCRVPGHALSSALPIARPSSLEGRIRAMLNINRDRRIPTRRARVTTLAGLLGIAIALSAAGTPAQTSPLPLTGHVYDASGGVLPEVALTLERDQAVVAQVATDASGRFEFPPVGPGRYVLRASLAGFRALRQELVLHDTRDWERAITLQVGTVQETIVITDRRRPGVTPGSSATPGAPFRVGGNIRPPRKTVDVKPVYPVSMRDAGFEGVVPIEAVIGTDGSVASVRVVSADVHPDFAIAAVDAVRQWRFTPTLLNGNPVEVVMTVRVQFSLSED
jgi:TonB family protein